MFRDLDILITRKNWGYMTKPTLSPNLPTETKRSGGKKTTAQTRDRRPIPTFSTSRSYPSTSTRLKVKSTFGYAHLKVSRPGSADSHNSHVRKSGTVLNSTYNLTCPESMRVWLGIGSPVSPWNVIARAWIVASSIQISASSSFRRGLGRMRVRARVIFEYGMWYLYPFGGGEGGKLSFGE